jgi:hypothetical protein
VDGWSVGVGFLSGFFLDSSVAWAGYIHFAVGDGEVEDWGYFLDYGPIIHKQRQVWMLDGGSGAMQWGIGRNFHPYLSSP